MYNRLSSGLIRLLRWSERYTKTDMVYLFTAGWWLNLSLVIGTGLSLVLSIAYANLLPAETYGTYQYFLSLASLVGAIALSGMGAAVAQAAARGFDGSLAQSLRVQLRFAGIPALLSLIGAAYYALHGNWVVAAALGATACFVPITNAFASYSPFLEGKRAFKAQFALTTSVTLSYYVAIFLTLFFFKNALVLLLVNLGINAVTTYIAFSITKRLHVANTTADPAMVSYGAHLSVLTAISTIFMQIDSVLVYHFLGPVELAIYSFATLIPERAATFFNFLGSAMLPRYANQTLAQIRAGLLPKLLRAALIGLFAAGAYAMLAPILFDLLFPKYHTAIFFTQVYAPIIGIYAVTKIANTALFAKRLTREIYVVGLLQPFLLVGLQIPFLLFYGIIGMIAARLLTDTFRMLIEIVFVYLPLTKHSEIAD